MHKTDYLYIGTYVNINSHRIHKHNDYFTYYNVYSADEKLG